MSSDKLITTKDAVQEQLNTSSRILDNLDELGEIMSDMLEKQQEIEVSYMSIFRPLFGDTRLPLRLIGGLRGSTGLSAAKTARGGRSLSPLRVIPVFIQQTTRRNWP